MKIKSNWLSVWRSARLFCFTKLPGTPFNQLKCNCQRRTLTSLSLIHEQFGDPLKVVKEIKVTLQKPSAGQLLLRTLAAPINPADINTIQGTYAVKPTLPCVPGNEGVFEVVEVGTDITHLKPGDWVIPRLNSWGTWRSHALAQPEEVIKIAADIGAISAATIAINPATAYRMLTDFVTLSKGDSVIQNGANSAVGQAVIQIASAIGVNTINVVRNRPGLDDVKHELTLLGATLVVTEEELRTGFNSISLPKPKLALNCVSGRCGADILRTLAPQGVMVTYGGMSRQPVTVPVGLLIFNDVTLHGFWMTRWTKEHNANESRQQMLQHLLQLVRVGQLKPPKHTLVPIARYREALENAMPAQGMVGSKQILTF